MRKVHEKSIILGIGIGMIITSIAGMIYSAGNDKELSKEEIISLAKGYGMVEKTSIINNSNNLDLNEGRQAGGTSTTDTSAASTSTAEVTAASTSASGNSVANTAIDNSSTSIKDERNIIVEINGGEKAKMVTTQLLEKGVITRSEDFMAKLNDYNATTKIKVGTYRFKKNEDIDYIVKTICNL